MRKQGKARVSLGVMIARPTPTVFQKSVPLHAERNARCSYECPRHSPPASPQSLPRVPWDHLCAPPRPTPPRPVLPSVCDVLPRDI